MFTIVATCMRLNVVYTYIDISSPADYNLEYGLGNFTIKERYANCSIRAQRPSFSYGAYTEKMLAKQL